ncbi:hypothetical protein GMST_16070 [Geomonas silvestris]|uniref:Nuclear transport factor 2 family protein n=1 Tax=Geomonas silvestris TaxID=2740184 RepID=A0A6V8MH46_9BACT|nr:hypothetical protein [Geomonas silvestris]GFO59282.1 hypothetical protein GMST_16070 [Geomonas silvestris]
MPLEQMTDQEVLALVNPMMDNLMEASTRIDHAAHTRDFTERIRAIVTPEHLEAVCRKYQEEKGFFASREPVAVVRRPGAVAVLWRQKFSKVPGDFVAEALVVEREGRYLIDHVMVW